MQRQNQSIGCTNCVASALFQGNYELAKFLLSQEDKLFPDSFYVSAQDFDFSEKDSLIENKRYDREELFGLPFECDHLKFNFEDKDSKYDFDYKNSPFRIESLTRLSIMSFDLSSLQVLLECGYVKPFSFITFEETRCIDFNSLVTFPISDSSNGLLGPLRNVWSKRKTMPLIKYALEQQKFDSILKIILYQQLDPNGPLWPINSEKENTDCLSNFIISSPVYFDEEYNYYEKWKTTFDQITLLGMDLSKQGFIGRIFKFRGDHRSNSKLLSLLIENGLQDFSLLKIESYCWLHIPGLKYTSIILKLIVPLTQDIQKTTVHKILSLGYGRGESFAKFHTDPGLMDEERALEMLKSTAYFPVECYLSKDSSNPISGRIDFLREILENFRQPLRLQEMCRIYIRRAIGGVRFKQLVNCLPIPLDLKTFIVIPL